MVGPDLVVTAVAQGRAAAEAMHAYMMKDDKGATDVVAPED